MTSPEFAILMERLDRIEALIGGTVAPVASDPVPDTALTSFRQWAKDSLLRHAEAGLRKKRRVR